jgi:hypothetical protein
VKNLSALRTQCGGRALMRAFYFLEENIRVAKEISSLKTKNFPAFLRHVTDSGNSSWKWLQTFTFLLIAYTAAAANGVYPPARGRYIQINAYIPVVMCKLGLNFLKINPLSKGSKILTKSKSYICTFGEFFSKVL